MPGLAVFWGELLAIAGAWESETLDGLARPLAVFAVIGTAVAAAYWLRVLRVLWHGPPDPRWAASSEGSSEGVDDGGIHPVTIGDATTHESITTAPLVLATVALGLAPGPLLALTAPTVRLLLGVEVAP